MPDRGFSGSGAVDRRRLFPHDGRCCLRVSSQDYREQHRGDGVIVRVGVDRNETGDAVFVTNPASRPSSWPSESGNR